MSHKYWYSSQSNSPVSVSMHSMMFCSTLSTSFPFRHWYSNKRETAFYTVSTLAEKGKGNNHIITFPALRWHSLIFAALQRLCWTVWRVPVIRALSSCAVLLNCQGTKANFLQPCHGLSVIAAGACCRGLIGAVFLLWL